jgi:beta-lactamase superfamily II metal-dependent hydrolase
MVNKTATLLTGDIELKFNESLESIEDQTRKNKVGILLAPHHGAGFNRDSYDWKSYDASYYIISYGLVNRSGHPHLKVIM